MPKGTHALKYVCIHTDIHAETLKIVLQLADLGSLMDMSEPLCVYAIYLPAK